MKHALTCEWGQICDVSSKANGDAIQKRVWELTKKEMTMVALGSPVFFMPIFSITISTTSHSLPSSPMIATSMLSLIPRSFILTPLQLSS
ncbi:hypothetical protein L6452_37051 [Arctium lappa]|uniref:Uncharacterized protein n=1 Tax=Arctium lappa TaxID=4217 RepID=A0ACB8Y1V3_ARCLA|nr:hypothetical protein L6452_37051 [Arctium lappa]